MEGGREAGGVGGGGTQLFQKGFIAQRSLAVPLEGRAQSVGVERERGAGEEGR